MRIRFLEIAEANFSSFSIELGRILFATASEAEVVAKKYCNKIAESYLHRICSGVSPSWLTMLT